jgi:rhomboid protease GluP
MPSNDLKMCQSCRALIPANAARCEMCGAEGHYAARAGVDGETFGLFANWPVTTLLLTLNILVYALTLLYQMRFLEQGDGASGFSMSPDGRVNLIFGSSHPYFVLRAGEWWRLIASCFLHGGPIHLLFNSMALIQAGRIGEEVFGRAQYICLYVLGGIGGNLLAIMFGSNGVVGASSALFGLIGALAVYGYRRRDTLGQSLRQDMIYWLLYGLAISFFPGISLAAHVGGALVGAALAWFLPDQQQLRRSFLRARLAQTLGVVAWLLILGTGALMARSVVRYNEMNRVATGAERVYTVWGNHQQLNELLKTANSKPAAAVGEMTDPAAIIKQIDKTQRALCSDIGALERLPITDEESGQLYRRMAGNLRARCDKAPPLPKESDAAALQQTLTGWQSQAEQGKELDELIKSYEQWLEGKANSLQVPVSALLPRNR